MDKMMKKCMMAHPLLHTVGGIGIGMLLVGLFPTLMGMAVMLGIVLIVIQFVAEFAMMGKM